MYNRFEKVYVDTSVVSGKFDQVHSWQTEPFWNAVVNGKIRIMTSEVLKGELEIAPTHIREFFNQLPESQIELVNSNEMTEQLAARYISEGVVGQSSLNDCRHIAIATIYRADCLVSLNFRHIVNVNRIYRYNGVNMLLGYPTIEIRTPNEVIYDET
jgi:predicted nucleic acid-binding protein